MPISFDLGTDKKGPGPLPLPLPLCTTCQEPAGQDAGEHRGGRAVVIPEASGRTGRGNTTVKPFLWGPKSNDMGGKHGVYCICVNLMW